MSAAPDNDAPLAGITVLEIGEAIAVPLAGQTLSDLGATVVKVENPATGDTGRHLGLPAKYGAGAMYHAVNRNKRSLALDLKDPAQAAMVRRFLLAEADVYLQGFRPGVVDALGLGQADLRAEKPALVCASLSAFSLGGPNENKPGYNFLMEAFGGLMSVTGEPDGPPVRVGVSLFDIMAGQWMALGVAAALRRRELTGEGCQVQGSLFETSLAALFMPVGNYLFSGEVPGRWGSAHPGACPVQAFDAADGQVAVAATTDLQFVKLAAALGHPEWAEEARFKTAGERWANRAELLSLIAPILKEKPRDHWIACLEAAGVPVGPVQNIAEMLANPETAASGMMAPVPGRPDIQVPLLPLSFDGTRPPIRSAPPDQGEFNDEFIARYGGAD